MKQYIKCIIILLSLVFIAPTVSGEVYTISRVEDYGRFTRVYIITTDTEDELANAVNNFMISNDLIRIKDVKYSISCVCIDGRVHTKYSAMIIYRTKK